MAGRRGRTTTLESTLNILAFATLIGVGIAPLLVAARIRIYPLGALSLLLGLFAITHGMYHLAEAYELTTFSDIVFEPLSIVFLIAFGAYYSKKGML